MVVEWQIYVHPDNIFCHSDGYKKVKKAHYQTTEPVSKFEFGDGETVIKTAEAKTWSWGKAWWQWWDLAKNVSESV